jgi:hypothetical protein
MEFHSCLGALGLKVILLKRRYSSIKNAHVRSDTVATNLGRSSKHWGPRVTPSTPLNKAAMKRKRGVRELKKFYEFIEESTTKLQESSI